jgi:hypothetical protein
LTGAPSIIVQSEAISVMEIATANKTHLPLPVVCPQNPGDVFHVPQRRVLPAHKFRTRHHFERHPRIDLPALSVLLAAIAPDDLRPPALDTERRSITLRRASFHFDVHKDDDDAIVVNQNANAAHSQCREYMICPLPRASDLSAFAG